MSWWRRGRRNGLFNGVGLIIMAIVGITWIVIEARDNDAARVVRVATLPHMEEGEQIATGPHTTIRLREFDYKGKRCLWVTSGGHQSGLTCWNKE